MLRVIPRTMSCEFWSELSDCVVVILTCSFVHNAVDFSVKSSPAIIALSCIAMEFYDEEQNADDISDEGDDVAESSNADETQRFYIPLQTIIDFQALQVQVLFPALLLFLAMAEERAVRSQSICRPRPLNTLGTFNSNLREEDARQLLLFMEGFRQQHRTLTTPPHGALKKPNRTKRKAAGKRRRRAYVSLNREKKKRTRKTSPPPTPSFLWPQKMVCPCEAASSVPFHVSLGTILSSRSQSLTDRVSWVPTLQRKRTHNQIVHNINKTYPNTLFLHLLIYFFFLNFRKFGLERIGLKTPRSIVSDLFFYKIKLAH